MTVNCSITTRTGIPWRSRKRGCSKVDRSIERKKYSALTVLTIDKDFVCEKIAKCAVLVDSLHSERSTYLEGSVPLRPRPRLPEFRNPRAGPPKLKKGRGAGVLRGIHPRSPQGVDHLRDHEAAAASAPAVESVSGARRPDGCRRGATQLAIL